METWNVAYTHNLESALELQRALEAAGHEGVVVRPDIAELDVRGQKVSVVWISKK